MGKAKAKRPSKVNALDDTDDEDFSDDGSDASTGCFALTVAPERPNFLHANPFDELADENEEDFDEEVIQHFANWAHKVQVAKKPAGDKKVKSKPVHITSLQELDHQMSVDPRLAALPANTKKLQRKIRKLAAQQIQLEDDECLALVDTGSSIHAADVEIHFPQYVDKVKESAASRRGHAATSAGGHKLVNMGKFTVEAVTDGQDVRVPFNNMKVKLPILSVRQMMSKGSVMTLTETDGKIQNERTGQTINFSVYDDLWFMKFKIKPPAKGTEGNLSASPFGRQGSR